MPTAVAILAIGIAASAAAAADGQRDAAGATVSMGFACATVGSHVRIEQSPDRTYAIIGPHERRVLRVCSGPSGARCRELPIHKFTFDCGGKPVEWINAAGPAVRGEAWKATLSSARMTLHYWPNGPSKNPRLPLTLPAGYAPAPASGLRFSSSEPPAGDETPAAHDGERSAKAWPQVTSLRFERPPAPEAAARIEKASAPRPTEVVTFGGGGETAGGLPENTVAMISPAKLGWSATAVVGADPQSWWQAFFPPDVPNVLLAGVGIAALLLSATAFATRQHATQPMSESGIAAMDEAGPDLGPPAARAAEVPPPIAPLREASHVDRADPVAELASALRESPPDAGPSDWSSVHELRTTAEALLDLVRQIVADHVPEGAVRDVLVADLAVIASRLEGQELADALSDGRSDLARSICSQAILDLERARTLSRIEHERALQVVDEQHRSPETVEEACAFLGINPRASEAIVKKVVDALRQNWHPDLAGDEADRRAREERIKQINAAWDLIRAR